MSLDGLRAWIGEVERKLTMRTRVFLVLSVLAIGAAGAALYFAIDTHEDAVSERDVQVLQERLEGQTGVGAFAPGGVDTAQLQSEIAELRSRLDSLESSGKGASSGDAGAGSDTTGSGSSGTVAPSTAGEARHAL